MMKKPICACLIAGSLLAGLAPAWGQSGAFSFGALGRPLKAGGTEAALRDAIEEADADNLAFVVANGIKGVDEPCSDRLYGRRKSVLEEAKNGVVLSLAASDWAECKNEKGKSAAIGRLNQLRDVFFTEEFSLGGARIPLMRQSTAAKFRSYGENTRWEVGDIMFATINLPNNNNHYLTEAGRNSEFEDRLVANRDWLHRLFVSAALKKADALVIFCDANPMSKPARPDLRRDGFSETRQQILARASKFPGKVLIVHGRSESGKNEPAHIAWKGNLGTLEIRKPWVKISFDPAYPNLFSVGNETSLAKAPSVN